MPKYVSEFLGTFLLVFLGCGAIIATETNTYFLSHAEISIIFGATVGLMIYAVAHISGAHFNPAVSLGFWLNKKISGPELGIYLAAQLTAALSASVIHLNIWEGHHSFGMTTFKVSLGMGVLLELFFTFILMTVILWVSIGSKFHKRISGLAVGLTIAIFSYFGGPLTGSSMNPARSFGPAIVNGNIAQLWIYLIIPSLGAILATLLYNKFFKKS